MTNLRLSLDWTPRRHQREAAARRTQRNVLVWHRRAGKTEFCAAILLLDAIARPGLYWYIAPFRNQARRILWDRLRALARPLIRAGIAQTREVELALVLVNGARLELHGADNPDALRGTGLRGVVYDEVAQMRPSTWEEVTLPALADHPGAWQIWIGTPAGPNHFLDLYRRVEAEMRAGQPSLVDVRTVDDTGCIDAAFLERARQVMTEAHYRQEFLCAWDAASNALIDPACVLACEDPAAGDPLGYKGGPCVVGVDLAVRGDLTVAVVLERAADGRWILRELLERRAVPLLEQVAELERLFRDYRIRRVTVDQTGLGEAIVELLQRRWGSLIEGLILTPSARIEMMQALRLAITRRELVLPRYEPLRRDLSAVRLEWTSLGSPRLVLDRVEGSHADRAVALALALTGTAAAAAGADEWRSAGNRVTLDRAAMHRTAVGWGSIRRAESAA